MKVNIKVWRLCLFIYLLLLIFFVALKFYGNVNDLIDRIKSVSENREMGYWNYNLVPLRSTGRYFINITDDYAYKNILGNIVPFMPLGFLLPLSRKRTTTFFKTLGCCFLIILFIEFLQLITMLGYFDIDDIWLNLTGCIIGYTIYLICIKSRIIVIV